MKLKPLNINQFWLRTDPKQRLLTWRRLKSKKYQKEKNICLITFINNISHSASTCLSNSDYNCSGWENKDLLTSAATGRKVSDSIIV